MKLRTMLSLCGLVSALSFFPGILLAQGDFGGPGGPGGPGGGGPGGGGMFGGGGPGGGNFDPAQMQQQMQQMMMEQVRQTLSITNDDEWAVIQALIQKVSDARRDLNSGGMGGMGGMGMMMMRGGGGRGGANGAGGRGGFGPQASDEQQALQKVVDSNAASPQIRDALDKYRAARKAKQAKLEAAQENLKKVLTAKQEAQIVLLGILD